jgi:hypothetical protein
VKLPVPDPSVVFVAKLIVGAEVVLQTTPLEVTGSPPSEEIFPPPEALVDVILENVFVVTIGIVFIIGFSTVALLLTLLSDEHA